MVTQPGPGRMDECLFLGPLHLLLSMLEINRAGLDLYVSCAELLQLCNCSHCQKRKTNHGQVACDDTCFSILLVAVAYNPRWSQLCEDVLLGFSLENLASVTWLNTSKIMTGNWHFFPLKQRKKYCICNINHRTAKHVFKTANALIQALTASRNLSILCLIVAEKMHLLIKAILLLLRTRQSSLQT